MDFGVLGPLRVRRGDVPIEIGALKQRALLIHLLLRVGQTVPVDRLIDALWGEDPPPQARVTLRSYVSSLRRVLDAGDDDPVIVTQGNGYGVAVPRESIDAFRFADLVRQARDVMQREPAAALLHLDEALGLWRGEALADVADSLFATGERARLEELRLTAQEERFDALLRLGRHAEAAAGLEALTAETPLRERPHGLLMTALYRSGRAADSLAVYTRFRTTLVEELGLDPTPGLQELADQILRQDGALGVVTTGRVPAAQADGLTDASAAATPPGPSAVASPRPTVGRNHELAELQRSVQRLLAGTGGLLLVTGEPGIGKSTLLEELAATASESGAQVRWGRCHETKGAPAFWPWIQVLRDVAADLDDDELRAVARGPASAVSQLVGSISARIPDAPRIPDGDLESARFHLYDAIAAFLLQAADRGPLVVLLDDLHWADAPTLEALAFLTPQLASSSLLVAATYRDLRAEWTTELEATLATVVRDPLTQQIALVGLQPDAVAELTEKLTGEALSAEQREILHDRTGGNPFFVRQLAQLRSDTGEGGGGGGDPAIPRAVTHVIARRLAVVPAEVRHLLECASVVGAQFDVRWLAAATAHEVEAALDGAAAAADYGLIEPVGRSASSYRFVHALVRETIYDGLTPVLRARIHAQIATELERTPGASVTLLAEHFWRAADVIDDLRPVDYLLAAADDALTVFAHEQAEQYLRDALELVMLRRADPTVELRVRVRLVQLLVETRGWSSVPVEEIAEPARGLARVAGSRAEVIPLWTALFVQYMARGDAPTARGMVNQLRMDADAQGDTAAMAAARIAACQLELSQGGDTALALELARESRRLADNLQAERSDAVAGELWLAASYMEACALAVAGEVSAARAAGQRSITIAEETGDPFSVALTLMIVGWLGMLMGDVELAAEASDAAVATAEEHRFQYVVLTATVGQGWARAQLGGDAAVEAPRMRDAVDALTRGGHRAEQARRLLFTAETYLLAGDHAAAASCREEAIAMGDVTGETLPAELLGRVTDALEAARAGANAARRS